MKRVVGALLLAALLAVPPASANDSIAEIRPGGLIFIKSDTVAMLSEDLYVSMQEVRVDYVFRNTSEKRETATVAFPMPVLEGDPWSIPAIPDPNAANFLGFEVVVEGKKVTPNLQQRAEVAGIDVTDVLKAAGLPLEPFAATTLEAIDGLSDEARRAFVKRGLLVIDTFDNDGTGMKDHYRPYWTLRTTFHWEMTFQPGVETRVSHRYKPSVGITAGLLFRENDAFAGNTYTDYVNRYCMDDAFLTTVGEAVDAGSGQTDPFYENRIAYVLTTGRNWAGPIRSFRLTVDKGRPENLVSFCADGVQKTGPTTFTVHYENYLPERDLEVLVLAPPR
jgi:hypothetical protein